MAQLNAGRLAELVLAAARADGFIPVELHGALRAIARKPLIAIAAAPKSGSTFLTNVLSRLCQLPYTRLCYAYSTNEHDLYLPALYLAAHSGCVSQLHVKGTFHNAHLLSAFSVKTIVLVRNIFDSVISLVADLREKETRSGYGTGASGYSFIWLDDRMRGLTDEQLTDAVIDLAVPWYVNFFVSWHRLREQGTATAWWVTYEQLMQDKEGTVRDILAYIGARQVATNFDEIVHARYSKFRDGRSGRGKVQLSGRQKERIRRLFGHYPDVDFTAMGLDRPAAGE